MFAFRFNKQVLDYSVYAPYFAGISNNDSAYLLTVLCNKDYFPKQLWDLLDLAYIEYWACPGNYTWPLYGDNSKNPDNYSFLTMILAP